MRSTEADYADRLVQLSGRSWKRLIPNPYRWHIRRRCFGRVLDVGCGIGRCLAYLDGRGVGVDPNAAAVSVANDRGLIAFAPDELTELTERSDLSGFDTLLCSHVLEHLRRDEAVELLRSWLPRVRPGGRVVLICPQQRGHASDPTHIRMMDPQALTDVCQAAGINVERTCSFPLPASFGRWWVHNETVLIGNWTPENRVLEHIG